VARSRELVLIFSFFSHSPFLNLDGKKKSKTFSLNQRLVDTAMLSAIGGLAYALGSVLRLQAYMG
jgi:hypothetical protein